MNYDAFKERCKEKGTSPTAVVTKLGISKGNITSWKNGGNPSIEVLIQIADILDCSVDYLLNVEEIPERSSKMVMRKAFRSLRSVPARTISLRSGNDIRNSELIAIAEYVNASITFLCNETALDFIPVNSERTCVPDENIQYEIFKILDNCDGDKIYKAVQIQLSRIILYNLNKKGIKREDLTDKQLLQDKLDFLYTGKLSKDFHANYGFNFSDITYLREKLKISYHFMFTGLEMTEVERLRMKLSELNGN